MAYSEMVIDYNKNPRNVGSLDKSSKDVGTGFVGAPSCGDVMRLQILVKDGVITDAKFKTFGCGSAIAASSMATEEIIGKSVDEAKKMMAGFNRRISEALHLPPVKYHCSILAEGGLAAAIKDYESKHIASNDSFSSDLKADS